MRTRYLVLLLLFVSLSLKFHRSNRGERTLTILYSELIRRYDFSQEGIARRSRHNGTK